VDLAPATNGFQINPGLLPALYNGKSWSSDSYSEWQWDDSQRILRFATGQQDYSAVLDIEDQNRSLIKLGFDLDFNPICYLRVHKRAFQSSLTRNFDHSLMLLRVEDCAEWNTIVTTSSMKLAKIDSAEKYLWRLKEDRLRGLDVYLDMLGVERYAHVTFKRITISNSSV